MMLRFFPLHDAKYQMVVTTIQFLSSTNVETFSVTSFRTPTPTAGGGSMNDWVQQMIFFTAARRISARRKFWPAPVLPAIFQI